MRALLQWASLLLTLPALTYSAWPFLRGAWLDLRRGLPGMDVPVAFGMRNWRPFIADALEELSAAGVTRVIGVPMAPQFSTLSVEKYVGVARASAPTNMEFDAVRSFHAHPLLVDAFAERIRAAAPASDEVVMVSAHSLPVRVIEGGDPYADEVAETARAVAARATPTGPILGRRQTRASSNQ